MLQKQELRSRKVKEYAAFPLHSFTGTLEVTRDIEENFIKQGFGLCFDKQRWIGKVYGRRKEYVKRHSGKNDTWLGPRIGKTHNNMEIKQQ